MKTHILNFLSDYNAMRLALDALLLRKNQFTRFKFNQSVELTDGAAAALQEELKAGWLALDERAWLIGSLELINMNLNSRAPEKRSLQAIIDQLKKPLRKEIFA